MAIAARRRGPGGQRQELATERGRRVIPLILDTRNEESVQSMVQTAATELGHLDILVNSAARVCGGPAPTLAEITEEYITRRSHPSVRFGLWRGRVNYPGLTASHDLVGLHSERQTHSAMVSAWWRPG